MIKTLTVLLLLFCFTAGYGQDKGLADLKKESADNPGNLALKLKVGVAMLKKGELDSARIIVSEVAQAARKNNNEPVFIDATLNLGKIDADKGQNVSALKYYQQALNDADRTRNRLLSAQAYKNIGALYISWKKFDDALKYYDKAETIAREINELELVADCQNNKGTVYEQQLKYDEAIKTYKAALAVYTQKNIESKIAMALSNVAIVYKFQKNYSASIQYNMQALALSKKTGNRWMQAATYNNIGNLYGEMGDYPRAIEYCDKSIALAKTINAIEIVESAYDSLGDAAAKAGDYKAAFQYHKQYAAAKDQFINLESTKQLSELNVKYETEVKQKQIQQQQFAISRRNTTIAIIIALFFGALVIGYLFYNRYRLKQTAILQQEVIKQQDLATKGIIDAEENERRRIAGDLHDGVGQLLSATRMNLDTLLERIKLTDPDNLELATKTMDMVDEGCKEVRTIAHQMMPNVLLKMGLVSALRDFVNKIDPYRLKIVLETAGLDNRLDNSVEIVLYRVIQETVNNVIKHAQASLLDIQVMLEGAEVSVTIEDNGRGFDATDKDKFNGIGIKNIIKRVEYLKGTVDISSSPGKGTLVAILIPLVRS